ncbi:restriction endonuclease subunit S [Ruminococcus sp.]|uniref:restriction endonuclease subunit S n=1 Tax=Ruminococcus sp. TaxID=41978 RepID=UPI003FD77387
MKKFLDCISIVGATPSKFHGTKKYVSTGAVATTEIDESEVVEVTYEDRPSRANLSAEAGDILFAKMQGTRKTLLLDSETEENIYSTGFYAVRANPEVITTECLYYLIDSELFLAQKDKNCSGATQKAITNGGMAKIEISVPALSEQGILVNKLKHLTQLIADKKKQLNLFDEIIKSRFIEMFGTLSSNEQNFEVLTIESLCSLIKDGTHQTPTYTEDTINGFKFLSSKDVMSTKINWGDIKYIPSDLHEKLYAVVKPIKNDILMSKNGVNYGVAAVNDTDEVFDIYVSLALLRPKTDIINPVYFRSAINSPDTKRQFDSSIKGIGVPNLHLGEIKKTKILVPPVDKQNEYVSFVEQVDKSKYHGEFTCEMEVAA